MTAYSAQADKCPEAYLATKGFDFRPTGTNQLRFNCPFCNPPDTGAHCYMDVGSGQYKCHKCGAQGNLRTLQRHFGDVAEVMHDRNPVERERAQILQAAADYCAGRLDKEPTRALAKRGITPQTADRFRVGYDDGTLAQYLIQAESLRPEQLQDLGLTNGDGNDSLYRRLIFPTIVEGRIVHLSGRSIDQDNDLRWQHIRGPIDHLFNEDSLATPEVIVTEGPFDCLTASQWGHSSVCMFGTGAAVGKLAEKLKPVGRVYICFDSDDPGKKAAKELAHILGPRARVVQLPEFSLPGVQPGKDLNDYLVSGATEEDFGRLLESAPTLAELLITEIPQDVDRVRLRSGNWQGARTRKPVRFLSVGPRTGSGLERG
jgi:DNA primase